MTQSVLPNLTVVAIERGGADNRAVRATLQYKHTIQHQPARARDFPGWFLGQKPTDPIQVIETVRGAVIDVGAELVDAQCLERFLSAGSPSAFTRVCRMAAGDTTPIPLRGGTLRALLEFGITPIEALVFCLNHGAKSAAEASLDSRHNVVETFGDTAKACVLAARGLRGVQRVRVPWSLGPEMPESKESLRAALTRVGITRSRGRKLVFAEKLGDTCPAKVLPPLAPKFAADLADGLQVAAHLLRELAGLLKRARKEPRAFAKEAFCREWYGFATEPAGRPLYAHGAALFAVTFGLPRANDASFKTLCARARKRRAAER
jgi:hypothetical protein